MKISGVKYLLMDVDGTLTDGKIYIGGGGEVMKAFHAKDGYGIHELLPAHGVTPVIVTGRKSAIVEQRCRELEITELYQGIRDKRAFLETWARERSVSMETVAYIGDDDNDLAAMRIVRDGGGIVACPADASQHVRTLAHYAAPYAGGCGAVRNVIEWLIARDGKGELR